VQSFEACQQRRNILPWEVGKELVADILFGRISLDVCHIKAGKFNYLLVGQDDLLGWVEARPLVNLSAEKVGQFLFEDWIMQYGSLKLVTMDGGVEFSGELSKVFERCAAKVGQVTEYYPEGVGMIEGGHQPLKAALFKMCGEEGMAWQTHLLVVLFADQISTKRMTGYSPYEMLFGKKLVLPVDIKATTYLGINWWKVRTTEDLVVAQKEELMRKEEFLEVAYLQMREAQLKSVQYLDKRCTHRLQDSLPKGNLFILYNWSLESQWGKLFSN